MRVGTNYLSVYEGRSFALAAILDRTFHHRQRLEGVGAVATLQIEIRKVLNEPRNVTARGLHLNRNADRIAVVFQQEKHRQFQIAGAVERLPEFSLAGSAVAQRNVDDFVLAKVWGAFAQFFDQLKAIPGLRAAYRLQQLRTCRRRLRNDIEFCMTPMRRHLTTV